MSLFEQSSAIAALPFIHHGFFGRVGGASTGDFAGLNVSLSVGDDPELVRHNRAIVADAMGTSALQMLKQVHSAKVETISAPLPGTVEADAMVTATPGLALGILTADCTPILFVDPTAQVIGAAHAGWRGAVDGIIGNTIAAIVSLGAKPENIIAAYGPTITGPNYEVGEQFRSDFLALHPSGKHHFTTPTDGQPHFDLPGFVEEQLKHAGVQEIERVGGCTYGNPDRYFSHRYATHQGTRTGRQIAVVSMSQV